MKSKICEIENGKREEKEGREDRDKVHPLNILSLEMQGIIA